MSEATTVETLEVQTLRIVIEMYARILVKLQARIDELETQLFIANANEALPLFEVMHLEPVPDFPTIRP